MAKDLNVDPDVQQLVPPGRDPEAAFGTKEPPTMLPRPSLRDTDPSGADTLGLSTEEAMQIGAIYGYQSMIQGLLGKIYQSLKSKSVFTVATGGDAGSVCKGAPEFDALRPSLTLDGLRLASGRMN